MVIKKKKIGCKNFSLQTRTPKTDRACFYQNETAWGWGVIIRKLHGHFGQAGMECALWPTWGDKVVGRAVVGKEEGQGTQRTICGQRCQEVEPQGAGHLVVQYLALNEIVHVEGSSRL